MPNGKNERKNQKRNLNSYLILKFIGASVVSYTEIGILNMGSGWKWTNELNSEFEASKQIIRR